MTSDLKKFNRNTISRTNSLDTKSVSSINSSCSATVRSKYEPQHSIHQDIADVFLRPIRTPFSRGHELPEPINRIKLSPIQKGKYSQRPFSSRDLIVSRGYTSGTKTPSTCSLSSRLSSASFEKDIYTRATSPHSLHNGCEIPANLYPTKINYPLNYISYSKPSILANSVENANLPSCAENILDDSRFESICSFVKKDFMEKTFPSTKRELSLRRRRKKIITDITPIQIPIFELDYEKRGSSKAVKRHVHKQFL